MNVTRVIYDTATHCACDLRMFVSIVARLSSAVTRIPLNTLGWDSRATMLKGDVTLIREIYKLELTPLRSSGSLKYSLVGIEVEASTWSQLFTVSDRCVTDDAVFDITNL